MRDVTLIIKGHRVLEEYRNKSGNKAWLCLLHPDSQAESPGRGTKASLLPG